VKNFIAWLVEHEAIVIIVVAIILLKLPNMFEPHWYTDEGIYLTIGRAMSEGKLLYRDVVDYPSKPPLIYYIAAFAKGELFWFKFVAILWMATTGVVFWKIANKWTGGKKAILATGVFVALVTFRGLEGNTVNAEHFFLLPNLVAFYILLGKRLSQKTIFLAGAFVGIASLIKFQAALEICIWPIVWWISKKKDWVHNCLWLFAGWAVILTLSLVYFLYKGIGFEYVRLITVANSGYTNPLHLAYVCILGMVGLVMLRNKRVNGDALVWGVWMLVTTMAAILSGKMYAHYFLQMVPPTAMAIGMMTKYFKRWVYVGLIGVWLALSCPYYINFGLWVGGVRDSMTYMKWFDGRTIDTYKLASILINESGRNDKIFVWGDDPMIYSLSKRLPAYKYMVRFHITGLGVYDNMATKLSENLPKYIIWDRSFQMPEMLREIVMRRYVTVNEVGNNEVLRRMGANLSYN
jgi:hypothetical protein